MTLILFLILVYLGFLIGKDVKEASKMTRKNTPWYYYVDWPDFSVKLILAILFLILFIYL